MWAACRCVAYSYESQTQLCYLKASAGAASPDDSLVSGRCDLSLISYTYTEQDTCAASARPAGALAGPTLAISLAISLAIVVAEVVADAVCRAVRCVDIVVDSIERQQLLTPEAFRIGCPPAHL